MNSEMLITLPGGCWIEGKCHRDAVLRPLNGEDESFLLETAMMLPPPQRTTALLTRCLVRIGTLGGDMTEDVRSLRAGDRVSLLLHLRRATLGDRLSGILVCPNRQCGERMELELSVADLLHAPYPQCPEWHEIAIEAGDETRAIHFRIPTGADLEAVTMLAQSDRRAARNQLLQRCLDTPANKDWVLSLATSPQVAAALSAAMGKLDPQAELSLNLTCPDCQDAFQVPLDIEDYFFRELAAELIHLPREIHLLAFNYRWSESEILAMPRRRRRLYLGHLTEAPSARLGR